VGHTEAWGSFLARDGGRAWPSMALPVRPLGLGAHHRLRTNSGFLGFTSTMPLRLMEFALRESGDARCRQRGLRRFSRESRRIFIQRELAPHTAPPSFWLRIPRFGSCVARWGKWHSFFVDGQRVIPHRAATAGFVFSVSRSRHHPSVSSWAAPPA